MRVVEAHFPLLFLHKPVGGRMSFVGIKIPIQYHASLVGSQVAAITLCVVYMLRAKVSCRNILLPYISKGRIKKFESDIPEKRD